MTNKTKPFLKYLGNKFNQVKQIKKLLSEGDRFVEPFVGSGSVFLNTNYRRYLLCDSNADLINVFQILAEHKEKFIKYCKEMFVGLMNNSSSYNHLRNLFNNIDLVTATNARKFDKAALFVYLNRHGFKGMTRYNLKGEFNVPFGYYDKPYFPEQEMLAFIEKINQAELVEFKACDFRDTFKTVRGGDVVYCDPPYSPLTASSNFTRYSGQAFTWYDQVELIGLCKKIKKEFNIVSVVSNHDIAEVVNLYQPNVMNMVKSFVRRSLNTANRACAPELLVRV